MWRNFNKFEQFSETNNCKNAQKQRVEVKLLIFKHFLKSSTQNIKILNYFSVKFIHNFLLILFVVLCVRS